QREQQAVWSRSRSSNSRGGRGGRGGGGGDKEDQVRERMDNIRVYSLIVLLKASQADPSTMPAMVEAGAISGLLMHLATAADCTSSSQQQQQQQQQQQRTPKKQETDSARAGGVFGQRHHGTDGNAADGGGDQTPPSLLLAARLLYAISLDPGGRSSLLEAKCLPPLIHLRRQLHAEAAAEATATTEASATTAAVQPALECTKRPADPNSGSAAFARKGGTKEVEKEAFVGNQQAQHSGGDVATGDSSSEPDVGGIEGIVSLIVDQLVGRSNGR
ncbi:unnamed protein product, partial [Ectocarpus sp. 8 AP-2014]